MFYDGVIKLKRHRLISTAITTAKLNPNLSPNPSQNRRSHWLPLKDDPDLPSRFHDAWLEELREMEWVGANLSVPMERWRAWRTCSYGDMF